MSSRLLIVSTLDSKEPFGSFTRPFYLGQYLCEHFDLCQLGIDCSAIDYAQSKSIHSRGLKTYIEAIRQEIEHFQPDVVYAQETLPAIAALIACKFGFQKRPRLIFDFHTLSANEYWTRLSSSSQKFQELKLLVKTYLAQGLLVFSGNPVIGAGKPVVDGIKRWFGVASSRIHCVGNGVPEDLLTPTNQGDPYQALRPAKIVAVVAPKTFQFPTNDMSVDMTLEIAKCLEDRYEMLQFVVIGREAKDAQQSALKNVSFTGFLPTRDDFVAHLQHAEMGLLPFPKDAIAGGARNKSLDFLACDQIVVSTPEGMRGLEAFHHNKHLLITDYAVESVAAQISDVAEQIEKYRPLAQDSSQLIMAEYSWAAKAEKVAQIIRQCL